MAVAKVQQGDLSHFSVRERQDSKFLLVALGFASSATTAERPSRPVVSYPAKFDVVF
jgi:hypothetical protein